MELIILDLIFILSLFKIFWDDAWDIMGKIRRRGFILSDQAWSSGRFSEVIPRRDGWVSSGKPWGPVELRATRPRSHTWLECERQQPTGRQEETRATN